MVISCCVCDLHVFLHLDPHIRTQNTYPSKPAMILSKCVRTSIMLLVMSRVCFSFGRSLQSGWCSTKQRGSTVLWSAPLTTSTERSPLSNDVPLYRSEGLFAVNKPLEWTSNDVVSYIRGMLERDTRNRGGKTTKVGSRRNKSRIVRVGHGGTLDPLATGVLVIGVGRGTKELQQ